MSMSRDTPTHPRVRCDGVELLLCFSGFSRTVFVGRTSTWRPRMICWCLEIVSMDLSSQTLKVIFFCKIGYCIMWEKIFLINSDIGSTNDR